jgi:hypothetical protein
MAWPRPVALVASLFTGMLLGTAGVLTALAPTAGGLASLGIGLASAPASAMLGVVIARRQPRSVVGMLLTLVGFTVSITVLRDVTWRYLSEVRPQTLPKLDWLIALTDQVAAWIFVSIALLLLYFPDGRLPGPRWRWIPPTLIVCGAIDHIGTAFDTMEYRAPVQDVPPPWGPPPLPLQVVTLVAFVLELVLVLVCAASLVVRYRRSDRVRRAQIKWLALAGMAIPLYPVGCLLEIVLYGRPLWMSAAIGIAGLVGIPIA